MAESSLEYCLVEGNVKADSIELTSQYVPEIRGVIRMLEIIEHRTIWNSNIPLDSTRLITRVVNDTPFCLTDLLNPAILIKVDQPLLAGNHILENMDVTYKMFNPSQKSLFTRFLTELAYNVNVRGIETTEKMLKIGTKVLVIGKLEKLYNSNGKIRFKISQPTIKGKGLFLL